jgi:hypothetical protein
MARLSAAGVLSDEPGAYERVREGERERERERGRERRERGSPAAEAMARLSAAGVLSDEPGAYAPRASVARLTPPGSGISTGSLKFNRDFNRLVEIQQGF